MRFMALLSGLIIIGGDCGGARLLEWHVVLMSFYRPFNITKLSRMLMIALTLAAYIGIMARHPPVPFYPYNVKIPRERAVLPSERAVP